MNALTFETSKQRAPRRAAWVVGAALAAAAAMMQPAVAGPLPLVEWNQPGASHTLLPCTAAAPGAPAGGGAGQKARAHGMYQFIKYGAAPPPPIMGAWQAAADCASGTPQPPAPVIPELESMPEPETQAPTLAGPPLAPPPFTGSTVQELVLGLASGPTEVPPAASPAEPQRGNAVPEPATGWLMGLGLLAAWGARRRQSAR